MAPRPPIVSWHDAAEPPVGRLRWYEPKARTTGWIQSPQHVWDLLRPKGNSQLGFHGLLGVILMLSTFSSLLRSSLRVGFRDNDGVTDALTRGGGRRAPREHRVT